MKTKTLKNVCLGIGLLTASTFASAGQLSSQVELATLLGAGMTMEDFEGNGHVLPAMQLHEGSGLLNSTSVFDGAGPGLVKSGADYISPSLWWNEDGYYGLQSRTLADSSAWRGYGITIAYTAPVTAFGFDMQGYEGFSRLGTVDVYGTNNALLASVQVNGGFFGWQDAAGIGRVTVSAGSDGYIMLDNHGYGVAAVPEPETYGLLLAGLGMLGFMARRRKHHS